MAEKWFYYVHQEGNSILRVNTDAFEWRLGEIGFRAASYKDYLKARKEIHDRETAEARRRYVQTEMETGE